MPNRTEKGRTWWQSYSHPLTIGADDVTTFPFEGTIDDVRVYNRALAPGEIKQDMDSPVAAAPGLVAGYSFNDGSSTTALDLSAKGNNGTIDGATWVPGGRFGGGYPR